MSTWHDPRFRDVVIDTNELGNLGEGWEIRYTAHGRRYFVDHINRTTQFTGKPLAIKVVIEYKLSVEVGFGCNVYRICLWLGDQNDAIFLLSPPPPPPSL